MWGFGKKKKTNPDGVNLLASILVCYPEITTISYEPSEQTVEITFALNQRMDEKEYTTTVNFIWESVAAYQSLQGLDDVSMECSMELQGEMGFLHIKRDLMSLTRGEVALLATLMRERFGDKLALDTKTDMRIDSESQAMQEEIIERILGNVQQVRLSERLVGIREEDHVVVFNR